MNIVEFTTTVLALITALGLDGCDLTALGL